MPDREPVDILRSEGEPTEPKLPVHQMGPNGLSNDYMSALDGLFSLANIFGLDEAVKIYRETGIKKYCEQFRADKYDNVVTPENEGLIRQLDDLVDQLRELFDSGTITVEKFNEIYNEINDIVRVEH